MEKHEGLYPKGKREAIVTCTLTGYLCTSCAGPRWYPDSRSEWTSRRARTRPGTGPVSLNSASVRDPVAGCKAAEVEEARMRPSRFPLFIRIYRHEFIARSVARSTRSRTSRSSQFNRISAAPRASTPYFPRRGEGSRMSLTGYTRYSVFHRKSPFVQKRAKFSSRTCSALVARRRSANVSV